MVEIKTVERPKIPAVIESKIKCPSCGNITPIEFPWGSSAAIELALQPLCCIKCGNRLD